MWRRSRFLAVSSSRARPPRISSQRSRSLPEDEVGVCPLDRNAASPDEPPCLRSRLEVCEAIPHLGQPLQRREEVGASEFVSSTDAPPQEVGEGGLFSGRTAKVEERRWLDEQLAAGRGFPPPLANVLAPVPQPGASHDVPMTLEDEEVSPPVDVELKVFPNAKELTESFAAFRAALKFREFFPPGDSSVQLVVVGDGKTPATAVTFALQTRWMCHTVDPRLRPDSRWDRVARLSLHANPIEEMTFQADRLVVVAVHAHVDADLVRSRVSARELLLVFLPCCVPARLERPPDLEYIDPDVLSGARRLLIWRETGADRRKIQGEDHV